MHKTNGYNSKRKALIIPRSTSTEDWLGCFLLEKGDDVDGTVDVITDGTTQENISTYALYFWPKARSR